MRDDEQPVWRNLQKIDHEFRTVHPALYLTETTTPADFSALGRKGVEAQRAQRAAALSPEERIAYRRGYLAAAKGVSRLRALIRAAAQGLRP